MTTTPPAPPQGVRARARALGERVPTKYVVTGLTGVVLLATAGFGGLADAPSSPLPVVAAGESVTGAQLRIAVERAVLIDGFPEQSIVPDPGKRLLVLVTEVENLTDVPVSTGNGFGAADNLRPTGVPGLDAGSQPLTVVVLDDAAELAQLQPRVPVELAYVWQVDDGALGAGDPLDVDVYDKSYRAEGFVTYGARYENPFLFARAELEVDDVGAGADG
ncbi:hypothetical protein [Herbiconiux sp. VKM Ac-2851]|uniref:hypothetical protein n=1 Tax=Herbiconiux sp. VKM Ac-2851 TaxID=2739025 RepID=UPI00156451BD|nr:hypothetical protein [Herbiconiux sp. VKM Ac-2851]NQX33235.1 hypothetical protein [Herbiconiux sp. VKM Ac-2851]